MTNLFHSNSFWTFAVLSLKKKTGSKTPSVSHSNIRINLVIELPSLIFFLGYYKQKPQAREEQKDEKQPNSCIFIFHPSDSGDINPFSLRHCLKTLSFIC